MEPPVHKKDIFRFWTVLSSAAVFIFLLTRGYIMQPDSPTYIEGSLVRGAAYPAFLALFRAVFGGGWLTAVVAAQLAGYLAATYFFVSALKRRAGLSLPAALLLHSLLLLAAFRLPLGEKYILNAILTEGLAFPAWLLFLGVFAEAFFNPALQNCVAVAGLGALLAFIRPQFVFVYPLLALSGAALVCSGRLKPRFAAFAGVCLVGFAAGAGLLERTWQYEKNGHFVRAQQMWTQLASAAFYIGRESDAALLANPADAALFAKAFKKVDEAALTEKYRGAVNLPLSIHYDSTFDARRNLVLSVIAGERGPQNLSGAESALELNRGSRALSAPVLRHRWKSVVKLLAAVFLAYMPAWCMALACILFFWAVADFARGGTFEGFFLAAALAATALNLLVVMAGTYLSARYTFYNEAMLVAAMLLFADKKMSGSSPGL
ncbi:MAG: hypothetical protein PHP45_04360 [Elusimicrobiales bacterium]|nr:hypothetical protein [Elusimicrobiales bacterium]